MINRHKRWLIWIAILLVAAILRLPGTQWDGGYALHPDERYVVDLSRRMTLFANPCVVDPHYAYGHLPLYLISPINSAFSDIDPLFAARLFSGILGILLVAVTGSAGRSMACGEDRVGWAAALILSFAPLLIQNARFYTVDILATLTVTISVLAVLHKRWSLSGICATLAVGSKISFIWIWGFLLAALLYEHHLMLRNQKTQHKFLITGFKLIFTGIFTYFLVSPWMILTPKLCWSGPLTQLSLATGAVELPYAIQYDNTIPYLYQFEQMALWGMGPVCVVIGIIGFAVQVIRWRKQPRVAQVVLLWVLMYGAVIGGLHVKFPRYMLPLYPWIAITAMKCINRSFFSRRHKIGWVLLASLCLLPTMFIGIAQISIYQNLHPWISASRWIVQTVQPGANILYEEWEHPLPLLNYSNPYHMTALPVYESDSMEKIQYLDDKFSGADVFVIASRRAYGALSQSADRFHKTLYWYAERIENSRIHIFSSCPHIGPLSLSDDPLLDSGLPVIVPLEERCGTPIVIRLPKLDESYRVYDAPTTFVLIPGDG